VADPVELRPEFNKAFREVTGTNPYSTPPQAAPRPSTEPLALIWHIHLGAITLALVIMLVLIGIGQL
jgi:hypothetical protein